MDQKDIKAHRVARLQAAVDLHKSKTALGKLLGYADGAFVRQMLAGKRPITEKTVAAVESLEGMAGWFDPPAREDEPLVLTAEERAWVLAHRAAAQQQAVNRYQLADDDKRDLRKPKVRQRKTGSN